MRRDANVVQMISVVSVQHRAVGYGQRQIHCPATAGIVGEVERGNASACAEAHVIVDAKVVAFAGNDHVVVTVITHFASAARSGGSDRAGNGKRIALTFLATKPATHPARFDTHGMHGFA